MSDRNDFMETQMYFESQPKPLMPPAEDFANQIWIAQIASYNRQRSRPRNAEIIRNQTAEEYRWEGPVRSRMSPNFGTVEILEQDEEQNTANSVRHCTLAKTALGVLKRKMWAKESGIDFSLLRKITSDKRDGWYLKDVASILDFIEMTNPGHVRVALGIFRRDLQKWSFDIINYKCKNYDSWDTNHRTAYVLVARKIIDYLMEGGESNFRELMGQYVNDAEKRRNEVRTRLYRQISKKQGK